MDYFAQHRHQIEKDLAYKLIDVFEKGNLKIEEVSEIAGRLNDEIEKINNTTELRVFLDTVSARWPVLSEVVTKEKAVTSEEKDSEVYSGVLALAQNGKIDKAIKLAKSFHKKS